MLQDFYQVVRRKSLYELSQTQPYLRHFPRIDEKPNCIQFSFEKQKKKLDSSYISFCGGSTRTQP